MKRRSFLWSMLAAPIAVQARSLLPAMQAIPELPVAPVAAPPPPSVATPPHRVASKPLNPDQLAAIFLPIFDECFSEVYKDMQ